jgi:hypothetical protein
LQIKSYYIARALHKFDEFMQGAHLGGGLFINGLAFVNFDMSIQIPFRNIGLLYHGRDKNKH